MAEYKDREHYIPLRRSDLVELLCSDKDMAAADREPFRQFCRLVTATYHFQYHQRLEELKSEYAPFDPDAVTVNLKTLTPEARVAQMEKLFGQFTWLMERANYKHLTREEIQAATEGASDWGINMDIDFSVFERLEVFVRGDTVGRRTRRRPLNLWRLEEVKLPIYQRLVLIVKLRPHKRLGRDANTQVVYLKLFKDIPKLDLEMLLPGARLQMPTFERGKLGASLLGTASWVGYKIVSDIGQIATAIVESNPLLFWGPLSLVMGYGYKQYAGYQRTRQTYSMQLTQSLYYQNLDNNAGVLFHLLDEAEEQECREAILAYYYLWRYAGAQGWKAPDLDDYVEMDLERLVKLKVDFEIDDALDKLVKLGLAEQVGERFRAQPLAEALVTLDRQWDNVFKYNNQTQPTTALP